MPTKKTIQQINADKPLTSKLTAISFSENRKGRVMVFCVCQCGKTKIALSNLIRDGRTSSCGCLFLEMLKETKTKYYPNVPELHRKYKHMISRCYDKNNKDYRYYGERGVSVCEEWRESYQNFLDWSLKNGWKPGLNIDKDKIGDGKLYSPQTCCYITFSENLKYRRKR